MYKVYHNKTKNVDFVMFHFKHFHFSCVTELNSKRKFPYEVYKFFRTGYGLSDDIMVGENIKIHTAIIIDDDDECERQVLQQLVDKRKKH